MEDYLDLAPCIYFSSTDDGTLLNVNEKLCLELNYEKKELIGGKVDVIFTMPTRIFQQTHLFPLLKMHYHAEEIFITLRKKSGDALPVLISASRKLINEAVQILYVGIVVHNRNKFEEELIAAKKAAEAALHENSALVQAKQELQKHTEALDLQIQLVNKQNEELKQFNRVITHDMQEPLRKLSVFTGILLEDNDGSDQRRAIEKIRLVTEQMKTVISGLQQYVWLNDAELKPVSIDLVKLLQLLVSQLKADFRDFELVIDMEEIPAISGDWGQMYLLFYQLLSNAIRFRKNNEKAFIIITANIIQQNSFRNVEGKYKYIDYLRIQVQDQGIGFDPVYKDQVFELFKRMHKEGGRGIGLSLCKKIIANHQGSISVDSKINEGTVVTLLLPLQQTETAALLYNEAHRNSHQ
jgi:sigma-B regulation protein RsbU (phosphoserine phosphatase)